MKKILFLILFIIFNSNTDTNANSIDCKEYNKLSSEFIKCKGKQIKDKTITAGQNIIKDTKNYQKKEWIKEKTKIIELKDKLNETKKKVLKK